MFKEKRNAIQQQLREIINQAKGRREEKGEKKSATAEYAKLRHEVQSLETTFETSSVGQKKEKEMIKQINIANFNGVFIFIRYQIYNQYL